MIQKTTLKVTGLPGRPDSNSGSGVSVAWDAPTKSHWGTKVYIGTSTGVYDIIKDAGVGTTTYDITNLAYNTLYFLSALHYNGTEESSLCTEITWSSPTHP